jgi:hypothetical protein
MRAVEMLLQYCKTMCSCRVARTSELTLALLVALGLASGCSTKSADWTEEVQLDGGPVVHVKRHESYKVNREIGGPTSAFVQESRLSIMEGEPLAAWVDRLEPVLLTVDPSNGEFVLVCTSDDEYVWMRLGRTRDARWPGAREQLFFGGDGIEQRAQADG